MKNKERYMIRNLDPYLESGRNEPCIPSITRHNVSTSGCTEATIVQGTYAYVYVYERTCVSTVVPTYVQTYALCT